MADIRNQINDEAVDTSGNLQVDSVSLQRLLATNVEILRQLTKLQIMWASTLNIDIPDDCIDPSLLN